MKYLLYALLIVVYSAKAYSADTVERTLQVSNSLISLLQTQGMNGFIEGVANHKNYVTNNRKEDIKKFEAVFGDNSAYIGTLGGFTDTYSSYLGSLSLADKIVYHIYSINLRKGVLLVALAWYKGDGEYFICKFLMGDTAEPYAMRLASLPK